uniref:(northern house mosquito) hypothetical protein n=1 Tax=Culex pipiens TaxID=7175 RepID=A0A8D8NPT0_CULPI
MVSTRVFFFKPSAVASAEAAADAAVVVVGVDVARVPTMTTRTQDGGMDGNGEGAAGGRTVPGLNRRVTPRANVMSTERSVAFAGDGEEVAAAAAAVVAVGNGAPVGDAPTRAESDGRCCKSFAADFDTPKLLPPRTTTMTRYCCCWVRCWSCCRHLVGSVTRVGVVPEA